MSIISKAKAKVKAVAKKVTSVAKTVAKTVASTVKSVAKKVSGSSQTGTVLNAPLLPGVKLNTPKTVEQPKYTVPGKNATYTTAGLASIGLTSSSPGVSSGTLVNQPSLPAGFYPQPPTRTSGSSRTSLSQATAPTSADQIDSGIGTFNLSGSDSGSSFSSFSSPSGTTGGNLMGSGTAGATAANEGLGTATEQTIKSAKELEAEQAKLAAEKGQAEKESYLAKIFKEQDKQADKIAKEKVNLEKEYKIQAKRAEITSLEETLGKMEVQVENQVMAARDVLGTNNFINNQIQQIDRNSRPALNRLRSDINFKTGILTQNEALIEKAMEQVTQESKDRMDNMKFFYNEYYDPIISKLDKRYDNALLAVIKEGEDEHDYQVKLAEWKRDTIMEYGLEGLTLNDSENVIARAAGRVQATKQALDNQNTRSLIAERSKSSEGLTPAQQKTYEAYKSQISTYSSKDEAIKELDKVKFGVIKAVGQAGYDTLIQDIASSTLRDKSLSWWDKLLGRK